MRLLLDTNVLVAALVARGTCSDLLEHCVRHHTLISAQTLVDELRDVLSHKFRQRPADVRSAIRVLSEKFVLVQPSALEITTCRDHDDDAVLATALAGECSAIVSGDQDLLVLGPFRDVRILAPSAFWQWEAGQDS